MGEPNWANQTIWTGDNLPIMRGMNTASVDLIYLDPPFNSKADYAAPIGSAAAGAAFTDTWTLSDVDVEWINLLEDRHPATYRVLLAATTDSDKSYLAYMAVRLLEMHRVLKPTGSLFLHCDPTMSHYLKIVLDSIYGRGQFRNEVVWCYTGPGNVTRHFKRKHDTILWLAKGDQWTFNADDVRIPYSAETMARRSRAEGSAGIVSASAETTDRRGTDEAEARFGAGKVPEDWWPDVPVLTNQRERVGYPTQKPIALLERIIKASSNPGDVVLDPFAGCATACVAAERLGRQWVGIDISPKAAELVDHRMHEELGLLAWQAVSRSDVPRRTDLGDLPPPAATCRRYTASRPGIAPVAVSTSRSRTSLWTTSSPAKKGAPTTRATSNCSAGTATASRATETWPTSARNSNSAPSDDLPTACNQGCIVESWRRLSRR